MKSTRRINDPFLYNIRTLDIHGSDSLIAIALVNRFIEEALILKEEKIIVIHGKGKGILKSALNEYLKKDKRILKHYIHMYNDGMTIIELKKFE